mmetsp:Transcript_32136/g.54922  ORF Transcript_32136/g.54922 Transcript_32136/m.54922 type:complete len:225 (-) Transcript_32136:445-1119(-)
MWVSCVLLASFLVGPAPTRHAALCAGRRGGNFLQMNEDGPDAAALVKEAGSKMKKSVAAVQEQLSTLRVGRATASMLDRVEVDYYGAMTPLNQLASVTAPMPSQLVVDVYDKSAMGDVEKALVESDLGMMPQNDGSVLRLNVPQLTEERRKELAKTAKSLGEDGKVAIRNVRKDTLNKLKKMKKDGLGEDEAKDKEDEVQKAVKKFEAEVEAAVTQRDKEIMTV